MPSAPSPGRYAQLVAWSSTSAMYGAPSSVAIEAVARLERGRALRVHQRVQRRRRGLGLGRAATRSACGRRRARRPARARSRSRRRCRATARCRRTAITFSKNGSGCSLPRARMIAGSPSRAVVDHRDRVGDHRRAAGQQEQLAEVVRLDHRRRPRRARARPGGRPTDRRGRCRRRPRSRARLRSFASTKSPSCQVTSPDAHVRQVGRGDPAGARLVGAGAERIGMAVGSPSGNGERSHSRCHRSSRRTRAPRCDGTSPVERIPRRATEATT